MRSFAASLAVALIAAASCAGSADHRVVLDGRPRYPDAQGVVASLSATRLVLDGGRAYSVSRHLQSFSSQTMAPVPLLQRLGQYVEVGLDGRTVVWIAAIGAVVPATPPVVYYEGVLLSVAHGRAIFRDGTVLMVEPGVAAPPVLSQLTRAEIDPTLHRVRRMSLV